MSDTMAMRTRRSCGDSPSSGRPLSFASVKTRLKTELALATKVPTWTQTSPTHPANANTRSLTVSAMVSNVGAKGAPAAMASTKGGIGSCADAQAESSAAPRIMPGSAATGPCSDALTATTPPAKPMCSPAARSVASASARASPARAVHSESSKFTTTTITTCVAPQPKCSLMKSDVTAPTRMFTSPMPSRGSGAARKRPSSATGKLIPALLSLANERSTPSASAWADTTVA
mmetsp:Transcript_2026/g.7901  ORF Transcript_2026/g.7901 Transcript_2026/m.7901 type:complete len:232 (+) Transcript_2026:647-1342(+)